MSQVSKHLVHVTRPLKPEVSQVVGQSKQISKGISPHTHHPTTLKNLNHRPYEKLKVVRADYKKTGKILEQKTQSNHVLITRIWKKDGFLKAQKSRYFDWRQTK